MRLTALSILFLLGGTQVLLAQPGSVDTFFNATDIGYYRGDGCSGIVRSVVEQPDGKLIVGGEFGTYNSVINSGIIRLNADGSRDASFGLYSIAFTYVYAIALQSDGKILVGGPFSQMYGVSRSCIARLNANGTLDTSFNPGTGATGSLPNVTTIAVRSDGRIIIGGRFSGYNGTPRNNIAGLNSNGTLDPSFNPGAGMNNTVNALLVQPGDQVLVAGDFTSVNGTPRNRIARLGTTGALDAAFDPGTGADGMISCLIPGTGSSIYVGGDLLNYNGIPRSRIARINANGGLDGLFDPGTVLNNSVLAMALRSDGGVIVGGDFTAAGGTARNKVAKLTATGSLDNTFDPGTGAGSNVWALANAMGSGGIYMGGDMLTYAGTGCGFILRATANGAFDASFNTPSSLNASSVSTVHAMAALPDGRMLVGGDFTRYFGANHRNFIRIMPDGALDPSFNPGSGPYLPVRAITLQPDGRAVIGGDFFTYDGVARSRIARIMPNGSLDASFSVGTGANSEVEALAVQPDGRILIGGRFTQMNGIARSGIARLNTDGSLDTSFDPGAGIAGSSPGVYSILIQSDGKVVISGSFTSYSGVTCSHMARLNANGGLDATFNPGTGANSYVMCTAQQPDGRLVIAGGFTMFSGISRMRVARLNADGSLDPSFDPGNGSNGIIYGLALQPDGKVVVAGSFNTFSGTARVGLARLLSTGALDVGFAVVSGSYVNTMTLLPTGKVMLGGEFSVFNGVGRNRILRLNADGQAIGTTLSIKAFLQGPYDTGTQLMSDALRTSSLIPTTEPYTALAYSNAGGGGETCSPALLTGTGNNAIVDWVRVELRSATFPSMVIASRNALLQRDGDVVDASNGTGNVDFNNVAPGNYHIAVRHRNHLGVMTATPITLGSATTLDLTLPTTVTYGTNARKAAGGRMLLWSGDVDHNGSISYTGNANDRDPILIAIGGTTPNNVVNGIYSGTDVNMDATTKYIGTGNDRDAILINVGGTTPNAVLTHQLP
jgi:uncharacterized delta-60 repeat protein